MILGIVGSREYKNPQRIKNVIDHYISNFGKENITIVSGGCPNGADLLAKKLAIAMELKYIEYPPAHAEYNKHCVLPSNNYGKKYHVVNFFERNTKIAEACDHLTAFTVSGSKCNGTMDTVNKAKKFKKQVTIFEDCQ